MKIEHPERVIRSGGWEGEGEDGVVAKLVGGKVQRPKKSFTAAQVMCAEVRLLFLTIVVVGKRQDNTSE